MPRVRKIAKPIDDAPSGPPPGFPRISQGDVAAWVGEAVLRRGMPYVEDLLFNTRRSGHTLKASCQGTAPQPYRVSASFGEQGTRGTRSSEIMKWRTL